MSRLSLEVSEHHSESIAFNTSNQLFAKMAGYHGGQYCVKCHAAIYHGGWIGEPGFFCDHCVQESRPHRDWIDSIDWTKAEDVTCD